MLPNDRVAERVALRAAVAPARRPQLPAERLRCSCDVLRVSDDDYWKDFPRELPSAHAAPAAADASSSATGALRPTGPAYARVQRWQVLQDADPRR